jgi:adenine-specific DNA methylase
MLNKERADRSVDDFPTNYVGSKRRILPWMCDILIKNNIIKDNTYFLDLFGGSGIVSYYLSCLGLRGEINDLMISSHFDHTSIFQNCNPIVRSEIFEIPLGVVFKEYKYIGISNDELNKPDVEVEDLFADIKEDERLVANEAIFESRNNIFNQIFGLLKNYILLHFTAKEAFELACVITNSIMCDKVSLNNDDQSVRCYTGDVYQFIEDQHFDRALVENTIAYIDPPYGGVSSNYHKIYCVLECIAFASSQMKWMMIDEVNKYIESGNTVPSQYVGVIDFLAMNRSFNCNHPELCSREWPYSVHDLPHIKKHGWRFNTSNLLDFKLSFKKLISLLINKKIPIWIFSFNGDSSWITQEDFIYMMKNEFNCEVISEKIDYDYSFRLMNTDAITRSMGNMTVGQETSDIVDEKKFHMSEEMLYICKRREM